MGSLPLVPSWKPTIGQRVLQFLTEREKTGKPQGLQCSLQSIVCKSFNITVIQAYAPITNVEEAEVEWFYEDLRDL